MWHVSNVLQDSAYRNIEHCIECIDVADFRPATKTKLAMVGDIWLLLYVLSWAPRAFNEHRHD